VPPDVADQLAVEPNAPPAVVIQNRLCAWADVAAAIRTVAASSQRHDTRASAEEEDSGPTQARGRSGEDFMVWILVCSGGAGRRS
jgi:hypothetical protein